MSDRDRAARRRATWTARMVPISRASAPPSVPDAVAGLRALRQLSASAAALAGRPKPPKDRRQWPCRWVPLAETDE